MPTPEDQRLARIQREADRAESAAPGDGLATCAGMDSQGRVLVEQGGVVRPLSDYQSNVGAVRGQPIEVADGAGTIAPRKKPPSIQEVKKLAPAIWWAVMTVDAGTSLEYWLGGSEQAPVMIFSAPKTVPACVATAYLYARHYVSPTAIVYNAIANLTQGQRGTLLAERDSEGRNSFCRYLQVKGLDHASPLGSPPNTMQSGAGPFSVAPNRTNASYLSGNPYFLPTSTISTNCGAVNSSRVFDPTEPLNPNLPGASPTECRIGTFAFNDYERVLARGKNKFLGLRENAMLTGPLFFFSEETVIDSYVIPSGPRGNDQSLELAILGKIPLVRLRHTRECVDTYPQPFTFNQTKTFQGDQPVISNWHTFPTSPQTNHSGETLFGNDEFYVRLIGGGIEWDYTNSTFKTGTFPATLRKGRRAVFGPEQVIAETGKQLKQKWQWPSGNISGFGAVF